MVLSLSISSRKFAANVPAVKPKLKTDDTTTIGWITITYRSVFIVILLLAILVGAVIYFSFPQTSQRVIDSTTRVLANWLDRIGSGGGTKKGVPIGDQTASFTMLDGAVKVKKRNSNVWVNADYSLPLEKGDVVQTGAEGMAKINFPDQTSYTVKQDSLIVIEENSSNEQAQTHVAVQVTTGTVDLSTGMYSQGSASKVIVAGATASLASDSSAEVKNDPHNDVRQILVKKGAGTVSRNGEVVSLSNYERVTFQAEAAHMTKVREVGPPTLIDPGNMLPIFSAGPDTLVRFAWTPMDNVVAYRIRISKNAYFTQIVLDKKVDEPQLQLKGIPEGAYYWAVQSIDARGKESVESERNRFTVIPRSNDSTLSLELEPFVQHGRIIEVRGRTDPGARVMVNGGEVPAINSDGHFRYLTPPLPNGESVITITAQNSRGGVNTQTKHVVIQ